MALTRPRPPNSIASPRRASSDVRSSRRNDTASDRIPNLHLQTAIGAYRGSTLKRILLAVIVVTSDRCNQRRPLRARVSGPRGHVPSGGRDRVHDPDGLRLRSSPRVAGCRACRAGWVKGLPFALEGYFEVLGAPSRGSRAVHYEVVWQSGVRPPEAALVHDVRHRGSHCEHRACGRWRGARHRRRVSGDTGMSSHRVPVVRNHRLPAHVHAVVEPVLVPLHRGHPIARVLLKG